MDSIKDARRSLDVAEHMLLTTYPVVDDPRLILAVADDIFAALTTAIRVMMDDSEADISGLIKSFTGSAEEKGFRKDDVELVHILARIIQEHKESPVEFIRDDSFVICDKDYNIEAISVGVMKKYLFRARLFIDKCE